MYINGVSYVSNFTSSFETFIISSIIFSSFSFTSTIMSLNFIILFNELYTNFDDLLGVSFLYLKVIT